MVAPSPVAVVEPIVVPLPVAADDPAMAVVEPILIVELDDALTALQ
jgi:hypothetical protein